MFNRSDLESLDLASKMSLLEDSDTLIFEKIENEKELKEIPTHIIGQLLINSISSPSHKRLSFNNLTGRLFVFNPNYFSINRKNDKEQIFKIVGLELKITPSLKVDLNVRTFSSLLLKAKMDFTKRSIAKYPKYTFAHSTQTLKRVLDSDNVSFEDLYILKQTSNKGREQKSIIPFLDFKSMDNFKDSKVGMLDELFQKVEKSLNDYAQFSFDSVQIENVVRYTNSNFFKSVNLNLSITDLIKEEDSGDRVKLVSKELCTLSNNIHIVSKKKSDHEIKLIHNKSFYAKYDLPDPYESSLDVQHITIEDFNMNSKASIKAVAYELALKSDIKKEFVSIVDWSKYNFSNKWVFGIKKEDSFYFLSILPNGKMEFELFEPNLFNQNELDELCDIFNENSEVEFLVKDNHGNINFITKTNGFSIPEYEKISEVLFNENKSIKLQKPQAIEFVKQVFEYEKQEVIFDRIESIDKWSKESLLSCFDNRADKKNFVTHVESIKGEILKSYFRDKSRYEILDSQLDIHHYQQSENDYYFVGVKGSGIQQQISRASIIRKICTYNGSSLIFDKLLPLMNVDFVKNGDLTVIPFPLKYLREWEKCNQVSVSKNSNN